MRMCCAPLAGLGQGNAQRDSQPVELRCQSMHLSTLHGGPRLCCATTPAGVDNRACPGSTAVTCRRPILQHGHKLTSSLATRAMNPWADSSARTFAAGICKARLAALSLTPLQLEASTP